MIRSDLAGRARAVARPLPGRRRATSSATASASSTRSTATARPTILLLPTWSIVHSRHWKAQIPYLARHFRVVTFDGRGNGQVRPPARRRGLHRGTSSPPTRSPCWTRPAPSARCSSGSRAARCWGDAARRRPPRARRGDRLHRPGRRRSRPGHPERAITRASRRSSTPTRAGRSTTATTGSGTTAGFLEFFFASVPRAALDQADRGLRRLGARDRPRDAGRHDVRRWACAAASAFARHRARVRCPVLVIHGDEDLIRPHAPGRRARRGDRRRPGDARGRRPQPAGPRPGEGQPAAARLRRAAAPPPARWTRGRSRARAARCSSPRRSGSATRGATSRSRSELRAAASRPGDRLAGAGPGHARAGGRGRARPPGQRASSPTSRRTSSPSRPSTTCTASRPGGGWTRSWSPTSWSSTTSCASEHYDLWIGDEAWELDYFLHENPELKRAAYAWLTDFVGWLPVERRGRA